jgi:hypothetical protein
MLGLGGNSSSLPGGWPDAVVGGVHSLLGNSLLGNSLLGMGEGSMLLSPGQLQRALLSPGGEAAGGAEAGGQQGKQPGKQRRAFSALFASP